MLGRQPLGLRLRRAVRASSCAAVFAYPLGLAVWISFHDYFFAAPGAQVAAPVRRAGQLPRRCSPTRRSAGRSSTSWIFLVINVPLTVVLALLLATALNRAVRGRTFLRVAYYVPYVTASVAVVAVWLFLFSGGGLVNHVLGSARPRPVVAGQQRAGDAGRSRSSSPGSSSASSSCCTSAALQNVPKELYEAASVDGAGRLRRFRT